VIPAFLFFGRHHGAPSGAGALLDAVRSVPLPIWVAIIGVLAAVLTPLLNHYFTRRRDLALARRDDRLRSEEDERRAARVRADLQVRLRAHCASLAPLVDRGAVDVDLWQAAHDALLRRARDPEVIDALGDDYPELMRALHDEAVAINTQRAKNAPSGMGAVIAGYLPPLRALGDESATLEFERLTERTRLP
jgi:hypothetical protein